MRISDWSSDVCSSDLVHSSQNPHPRHLHQPRQSDAATDEAADRAAHPATQGGRTAGDADRSEEHTSELQSLMRTSYDVFCLKKKNRPTPYTRRTRNKPTVPTSNTTQIAYP